MSVHRERFSQDGYLHLKGLLPGAPVMDFRRSVFQALESTGILHGASDISQGVFSGRTEQGEAQLRVQEIVRWASYEAFCLSTPILKFYESFFGGPVYLHKRKILRYTVPGDPSCTGAHYDLTYLRAGTDALCTSWIPIGDIPVAMGGLIYLEGSHSAG
jgi:ectoine hydroxylase-related dioxygenase (phytanoyl-CoA dioxygenase family)